MRLRRLSLLDLNDCIRLAVDRDWPPEKEKWRLLFEVGEVYGIEAADGDGLAGSVVLTPYGPPPEWPDGEGVVAVSMVLVAARYARQGLGRRLMEHALDQAGPATSALYATELGRPLYEQLGFQVVEESTMYTGALDELDAARDRPARSRLAEPGDLPAIAALDARALGADRSALLQAFASGFATAVRVLERDVRMVGYAGAWRTGSMLVVGPLAAEDDDAAATLLADFLADAVAASHAGNGGDALIGVGVEPIDQVRIDVSHRHEGLHDWARRHGFAAVVDAPIMTHGPRMPDERGLPYLPMMKALL